MTRTTTGPRPAPQRRGRRRRTAVGAVLALAAATALATGLSSSADSTSRVAYDADTRVLSFSLPAFAGGVLDAQDLRGTPVVLNGYASWCALCLREMPDFERVHRAAGDRVAFVGFNPQRGDTDAAQARTVADTGVTYPTVRDPDDRLLRAFNPAGGLPITLFVDADGVVRKVHRGVLTEQQLTEELRDVLGVVL